MESPDKRQHADDLGERAFLLGDSTYRSDASAKMDPKTTQDKIWQFMEYNRWINYFLLGMIFLSTVSFCLETMKGMETKMHYFFYIEVVVSVVFSVEYLIRFYSAPMTSYKFVTNTMNVIDLVAILPFYIEMFYVWYERMHGVQIDPVMDLRTLRCLRLARLFKFGRYNSELSLVTSAFIRSSSSFTLLGFMLCLALVFFSTLMYIVERGIWDPAQKCFVRNQWKLYGGFREETCSPFQSIPQSFWWAMTTMTTVGYGDTYPLSPWGKVIGGACMVCGILSVALPTTVLGVQFGGSYVALQEEREIKRMRDLLPDEADQAQEYLNQVEFVAKTRMEITKLLRELETVTPKLKSTKDFEQRSAMFRQMVKLSAENFESFLLSIDQPATERLSKGKP